MAGTRERALDAALQLLEAHGLRAVTHLRVDAAAGLPRGSTSNSFRTRAALLDGVMTRLAERELADFGGGLAHAPATPDELAGAIADLVVLQTTTYRGRTLARYALFLEASRDPEVGVPLVANRRRMQEWVEGLFRGLEVPDAVVAARGLMACADGLILHRLTVDPDAPVHPPLRAAMRGFVRPA